jgi:DNA-directed RNA polymerase subunit RPC12/RpoP
MGSSEQSHVRFACPDCGARLKAPAERAGRRLRCPECGESLRVPENGAPEDRGSPLAERHPSDAEIWIPVECLVCGTRMHAGLHEVGRKIRCPDCDTLAVVPPPPPPPKKRALTPPTDGYAVRDEAPPNRGRIEGPTIEVVCPHCGHRQAAPAAQQGRKLSCAGCFLMFVVAPPAPTPPPAEAPAPEPEPDEGLRLSEPAPRRRPTIPDFVLEAEEEPPPASAAPFASRPELSRPLGPRPELPAWPLVQGVFLFPFAPGVWTRWLSLSLGAAAILILISNAVVVSQGGPGRGWFLALLFSILAVFGAA